VLPILSEYICQDRSVNYLLINSDGVNLLTGPGELDWTEIICSFRYY
jgi:hypothetical protein